MSHLLYGRRGALAQATAPTQSPYIDAWVDRYSIGHYAVGVLMGLGRFPWWLALGLSIGWELVEDGLKSNLPAVFPDARPEALNNHFTDIVFNMLGWGTIATIYPEQVQGYI